VPPSLEAKVLISGTALRIVMACNARMGLAIRGSRIVSVRLEELKWDVRYFGD
jgi:hypothetical protein